mgnify:CR=1 FL=1
MPFETASKRVFAAFGDSFSRVNGPLGSEWTMIIGTDGTHVSIDGQAAIRPTTGGPVVNPQARFERDIDPALLARTVRASFCFRLRGAAPSDESAVLLVYGMETGTAIQACAAEMRWIQATNTIELRTEHRGNNPVAIQQPTVTLGVYHRLGLELTDTDMRVYLALSVADQEATPTNNNNLSLIAIVTAGGVDVAAPFQGGISMGGEVPSGNPPIGIDAYLIEEVEGPSFADPRFPGGVPFEVPVQSEYTRYKSSMALWDRLTKVQI